MRARLRAAGMIAAMAGLAAAGLPLGAKPAAAAGSQCNPDGDMRPVFSPDGSRIAMLAFCPGRGSLDIRVAPVRHEATLAAHRLGGFDAALGKFTSNDTITWVSSAERGAKFRGRFTKVLSIYERDLNTDQDRLILSREEPFVIGQVNYHPGGDCDLIDAAASMGPGDRRHYLFSGDALTPAILPEGVAVGPRYWDSSQKAFIFQIDTLKGPDRLHPIYRWAKASCDGRVEDLPAAYVSDDSLLADLREAAYAPGTPLVAVTFGGGRPSTKESRFGAVDTSSFARAGALTVQPWEPTWPPYLGLFFRPFVSSRGKYVGLDFGEVFYVLRASDHEPVFNHVKGPRMSWARPAFTPDETRYVLITGDRLEVYPIE